MTGFTPTGFVVLAEAIDRVRRERGGGPAPARGERARPAFAGAMEAAASALRGAAPDPLRQAEDELLQAFGDAALPAWLQRAEGGQVPIPAKEWQREDAREAFRTGRMGWTARVVVLPGPAPWGPTPFPVKETGRVLLEERQLAAWMRGDEVPASPSAVPPTVGPAPVPAETSATRQLRRNVPQAEVERWYRHRVKEWPADENPPSADRDFVDARKVPGMASVTRDAIRAAREVTAPDAWRKPGRRKSREKM